tara:strand:+ start:162742 stop:163098 length:357 start_codon:yes stop_codon:yes gene_type:complete
MSIRRLSKSLEPCVLFISLCGFGFGAHAEGFDSKPHFWGGSDEDTILVEDEADFKISYSKAIKSACKNLIGFDIDKYFSGGKNKRSAVIRQLNDLSDRSYYRLRVDEDTVRFKFTLNL